MRPVPDATRELPSVPPLDSPESPAEPRATTAPKPVGSGDAAPESAAPRLLAAASRLKGRLGPGDGGPRDRRTVQVIAGAAVLVLALVLTGVGLLISSRDDRPPAVATQPQISAVDPATVRASASSVQEREGGITYDVANTLDGDPNTAWNSDGARDGQGPGISLTYTFAAPVDLRSLTVRNGYQKSRARGKTDLWRLNGRVKQFQVTTPTGRWTWDLADRRDPQTLQREFGRTTTVRLTIRQVYRSDKYPDVAISEIAFTRAQG